MSKIGLVISVREAMRSVRVANAKRVEMEKEEREKAKKLSGLKVGPSQLRLFGEVKND